VLRKLHSYDDDAHDHFVKHIKNGAYVNIQSHAGWTPLIYASEKVNYYILVFSFFRCYPTPTDSLCVWTHQGNTTAVQELIKLGANINHAESDGWTALHFASLNGHEDTVNALLTASKIVAAEAVTEEMRTAGMHLMEAMRAAGVPLDASKWNTLLEVYLDRSDLAGARAVMEEMRAAGVQVSEGTWNTLLKAYVDRSDFTGARSVMKEMRAAGGWPPTAFRSESGLRCLSLAISWRPSPGRRRRWHPGGSFAWGRDIGVGALSEHLIADSQGH
jgi:pentatricopeptide repeat protein